MSEWLNWTEISYSHLGNSKNEKVIIVRPSHYLDSGNVKRWLIGKDPDAGRDWGQEEKGTTEDEMASPTRWAWVWVNSGSWWWTGRPGVLQFMESQRVGHNWATELNWIYNDRNFKNRIEREILLKRDTMELSRVVKIFSSVIGAVVTQPFTFVKNLQMEWSISMHLT